jgi:hypothetical protein
MRMPSQRRDGWLLVILLLISAPSVRSETRPDAGRETRPDADQIEAPAAKVSHRDEEDGWRVAETANFRLFHHHSRALAESLLQTAERTRTTQLHKWFGTTGADWDPKCLICFYASGEAYSEATGVPANVNGHTDVMQDDGRVLSRCIHLHGDRDLLLHGVLPHEVTHAVLAGRFGERRVPPWADEGIAVLAEARPRIELHLRQLPRCREDQQLFSMRKLIQMRDYPQPRSIPAFYAQSVSLVEFLTQQKGAKRFAAFVRDGVRDGYETSLRRHYGWDFAELDRRWQRYAFPAEKTKPETVGGGG